MLFSYGQVDVQTIVIPVCHFSQVTIFIKAASFEGLCFYGIAEAVKGRMKIFLYFEHITDLCQDHILSLTVCQP